MKFGSINLLESSGPDRYTFTFTIRFRIKALHSSNKVYLSHNERPLSLYSVQQLVFLVASAFYFCEVRNWIFTIEHEVFKVLSRRFIAFNI
jgi:hypothetical protein